MSVPSNPASHRQPDTADTATAPFVPELSVHAVQDVAAAVNEYVSAAQSVQAVAGLESKSAVPAAQSVHDVEPCGAYWPLEQLAQAEEGSLSVSAVPGPQSMHVCGPMRVF